MIKRKRIYYLGLLLLVIFLGLASRRWGEYLPIWLRDYAGDTLWGVMVFLLFGLIFKHHSTKCNLTLAIVFSFAIEFSQLYHAVWLDTLRKNRLGALILGTGFLWTDLICYLLGIGFVSLFEIILKNKYIK